MASGGTLSADSDAMKMTRPQAAVDHGWHQRARQARAREHVGVEEAPPCGIVDLEEIGDLEHAHVVHQHVDRWHLGPQCGIAFVGGQVGRHAGERRSRDSRAQRLQRLDDRGLAAAVDDDVRA